MDATSLTLTMHGGARCPAATSPCPPSPRCPRCGRAVACCNGGATCSLWKLRVWVLACLRRVWLRVRALPFLQFYWYMYMKNKGLLLRTLFVNYALPLALDVSPWWFLSRSKLSKELRDIRSGISHSLIDGTRVTARVGGKYFLVAVMYALLHTVDHILRSRVDLECRLFIKRMIMERILYSELGSLQNTYRAVFQVDDLSDVRTQDVESRVFSDISLTLHFVNFIVPNVIRGCYFFTSQAFSLYRNKALIDVLALLRPTVVSVVEEVIGEIRLRLVDERQVVEEQRNAADMSRVVSNMVDGLHEVQVNNLQQHQLEVLDTVIRREVNSKQGVVTFVDRLYRTIQNRSVLDFLSDAFVAQHVMAKHSIDHKKYRGVQMDIEVLMRTLRRLYSHIRAGWTILETQSRVIALVDLPSFSEEESLYRARLAADQKPLPDLAFSRLTVSRLSFRFQRDSRTVLDIRDGPIIFEKGRTYAVVGRNGSGKSTLLSILCKLYQTHSEEEVMSSTASSSSSAAFSASSLSSSKGLAAIQGKCVTGFGHSDITYNGHVNFNDIPRTLLRERISYISQRPYIFPGTVEDNIRIAAPRADRNAIKQAVKAAGVAYFLLSSTTSDSVVPHSPSASPTAVHNDMRAVREQWDRECDDEESAELLLDMHSDSQQGGPRERSGSATGAALSTGSSLMAVPQAGAVADTVNNTSSVTPRQRAPLKPWEMQRAWWRAAAVHGSSMARALWAAAWPSDTHSHETHNKSSSSTSSSSSSSSPSPPESSPSSSVVAEPGRSSTSPPPESKEVGGDPVDAVLRMTTSTRGGNLSGGLAQSLALARVFMKPEADIVILDEALGQMDTVKKKEIILPALMNFVKRHNMTLIVVSHDVAHICPLMDHVYVLRAGQLVHQGSHQELVEQKATEYCTLLGEQPLE